MLEQVRRVQQRLGGNAAHVQAGAAQRAALLHARGLRREVARRSERAVPAVPPDARALSPSCAALMAAT